MEYLKIIAAGREMALDQGDEPSHGEAAAQAAIALMLEDPDFGAATLASAEEALAQLTEDEFLDMCAGGEEDKEAALARLVMIGHDAMAADMVLDKVWETYEGGSY